MNLTEIIGNDPLLLPLTVLAFGLICWIVGYLHPARRTRVERGDDGCDLEAMACALEHAERHALEDACWIELDDEEASRYARHLRALSRAHGPVSFIEKPRRRASIDRYLLGVSADRNRDPDDHRLDAQPLTREDLLRPELDLTSEEIHELSATALDQILEEHGGKPCLALSPRDGGSRCALEAEHRGAHQWVPDETRRTKPAGGKLP